MRIDSVLYFVVVRKLYLSCQRFGNCSDDSDREKCLYSSVLIPSGEDRDRVSFRAGGG